MVSLKFSVISGHTCPISCASQDNAVSWPAPSRDFHSQFRAVKVAISQLLHRMCPTNVVYDLRSSYGVRSINIVGRLEWVNGKD